MNFKFIINLIIIIFFLSCDNTSTNPDNGTTTTGSGETNLIEIYYGSNNQEGQLSIANPNLDLRIILNHCSKVKKDIFFSNFTASDIDIIKFNHLFKRRLNHEPISKITNKKSFWKYDFYVNQNVIDPRPETELIIEESLKLIKNTNKEINILDIGTGSGCLAISLAKEFKKSKVIAIDISPDAIKVARKNIRLYNCKKQISSRVSTLKFLNMKFDLIVSNPPYLSIKEYNKLSVEILKYEPKIAFLAGTDGLLYYKNFARKLPKIMKNNSYLVMEIGENQAKKCTDIFKNSSLKLIKKAKDLQKKDRILVFSKLYVD